MTKFSDLNHYFDSKNYKMIMVSDAEPKVTIHKNGKAILRTPAGGVAVALDPIASATNAYYIARAKYPDEKEVLNDHDEIKIKNKRGEYTLRRLFFEKKMSDNYYYGFSNQTLWPLCHVAFEEPKWTEEWYQDYKKVNEKFAKAIDEAIDPDKNNFIWINDYQLSLVPALLKKRDNVTVAMFWHIPWPTWEVFRILPYKDEILNGLLHCDFLAFHRGYQARNFLDTVEREFQLRIDQETQTVFYNSSKTHVLNLPMGIDTDVIRNLVKESKGKRGLRGVITELIGDTIQQDIHSINWYFDKYKVILAVSRLDYTKGIKYKLLAMERFFEKYPEYREKAIYVGVIAPSREPVPAYQRVKKEALTLAEKINAKYGTHDWKPIHLVYETFHREDVISFYNKAEVCVVTPLDDGMNLVSKEYVIAASESKNPGMIVLSQFAGSAIDLTSALIVNPYDLDAVADATKQGLEMPKQERVKRIKHMTSMLEDRNIYDWGIEFIRQAIHSKE